VVILIRVRGCARRSALVERFASLCGTFCSRSRRIVGRRFRRRPNTNPQFE
jgi:hypothetical protein